MDLGLLEDQERGRLGDRPAIWYLSMTPGRWPLLSFLVCSSANFYIGAILSKVLDWGIYGVKPTGGLTVVSIFKFQEFDFTKLDSKFLVVRIET